MTYEEIIGKITKYIIPFNLLDSFDCRGIHNFSIPTLESYFYLSDMLHHTKTPALLAGNVLLMNSKQGRYKSFCYSKITEDRLPLVKFLQTLGPVYSIDKIEGLIKESRFKEVGYSLGDVFNPASYLNAKKRYSRLTYPIKQIEKHKITCEKLYFDNIEQVRELHDEWVERKMDDPNTFRMMFPNKRYIVCCEKAIDNPNLFKGYVFSYRGKISAVRVLGIQDKQVFDLANFGAFWNLPSQMMNYLDTYVLKDLFEKGFETFNCGAGLNKRLTMFKKHYPSIDVISYAYGRNKEGLGHTYGI